MLDKKNFTLPLSLFLIFKMALSILKYDVSDSRNHHELKKFKCGPGFFILIFKSLNNNKINNDKKNHTISLDFFEKITFMCKIPK